MDSLRGTLHPGARPFAVDAARDSCGVPRTCPGLVSHGSRGSAASSTALVPRGLGRTGSLPDRAGLQAFGCNAPHGANPGPPSASPEPGVEEPAAWLVPAAEMMPPAWPAPAPASSSTSAPARGLTRGLDEGVAWGAPPPPLTGGARSRRRLAPPRRRVVTSGPWQSWRPAG